MMNWSSGKASLFLCLTLSMASVALFAQPDTLPTDPIPEESRQVLEDFLQSTGSEGNFDFNTIFEDLEAYRERPIDLNRADENQLRELRLLSDVQILNLLRYRQIAGDLISLYELQAVPGFDLSTIQAVLPFVRVGGDIDDYQERLGRMLREGRNELYLRWSRIVEQQRGFEPLPAGSESTRYLGDPNQLYLRYKHSFSNRLSYGFTAEKDRGEEFFSGNNPRGFDFYSAHLFLRNYSRRIRAVALGDYNVSFGQGLILFSGFNYGKSVQATTIKRSGQALRPYTSVNEVNYLRGAAATIGLTDNLELTAFASSRGRDGNLIRPDTLDADQEIIGITSLDEDGLHRTPAEIDDRNAVRQFTVGGSLKYRKKNAHFAVNALLDRFDKPLQRRIQPYSQYYFNGDQLANVSTDYSWVYRNLNFFGETALSDNGGVATLNGLLLGLDPKVDLAVLHRYFARDYQAPNASPFAETTGARNEAGLYLGLVIRPARNWRISGYYDTWRHPWLRFDADAPSRGHEYRLRITHFRKRRYEAYLEVRDEVKEKNVPLFESKTNWPVPSRIFLTRLHFALQLSKSLEWRTRIDAGFADNEINSLRKGFVIYQDFLFRPAGFPLSFTTRFALMDTDGFQIRFYSFENDLLYSFSIPAYYNKGSRFYFNLRYRGIRNLTLECRFAQTYWLNQDSFGSGLESIDGNTRTQVSAQVKYQF